jgi:hypothetical protein
VANKQLLQAAGDGTTVPAGYIGESGSIFGTGSGIPAASGSYANVLSQSMPAGIWLCQAVGRIDKGTSDINAFGVAISDSSTTPSLGQIFYSAGVTSGATIIASPSVVFTKNSSWTLYVLCAVAYTTLGTGRYDLASTNIKFVRIA